MLDTTRAGALSLAALIGLGATGVADAQGLRADSSWRDLRRLGGDVWSVWTSPAHGRPRDYAAAGGAAAVIGVSAFGDAAFSRWLTDHAGSLPVRMLHPVREGWKFPLYELGSGQYLLPLSAVLYVAGGASHSRSLQEAGIGCAAAHLASAGVRDVAYALVARDRPRIAPDDPFKLAFPGGRDWNRHSFLSGHTANSMGCASFLGSRFSLGIAEPAMYLFVLAVGAGRVADGRHWPSDIVAGAVFGFADGKAMSDRSRARARERAGVGSMPLVLRWRMTF